MIVVDDGPSATHQSASQRRQSENGTLVLSIGCFEYIHALPFSLLSPSIRAFHSPHGPRLSFILPQGLRPCFLLSAFPTLLLESYTFTRSFGHLLFVTLLKILIRSLGYFVTFRDDRHDVQSQHHCPRPGCRSVRPCRCILQNPLPWTNRDRAC